MISLVNSLVTIPAAGKMLKGDLVIPEQSRMTVLFAHGSGSSRLSPRNRQVAAYLQQQGMATLLFDLLSIEEDEFINRFNIPELARRLVSVSHWIMEWPGVMERPLGYFGASTGAAAALWASLRVPEVKAVVSRGGRPDLAMGILPQVKASTLLLVGSLDHEVLALNRSALSRLTCQKELEVVPGASHLFSEPGTLEAVQEKAAAWFMRHARVDN